MQIEPDIENNPKKEIFYVYLDLLCKIVINGKKYLLRAFEKLVYQIEIVIAQFNVDQAYILQLTKNMAENIAPWRCCYIYEFLAPWL